MKQLRERVAVVTGAASGIGWAMAQCFAGRGMKLVLSDIEPAGLERARDEGIQRFVTEALPPLGKGSGR